MEAVCWASNPIVDRLTLSVTQPSARLGSPQPKHTHTPTPQNHPQQLIGRINKVGVLSPRFDVKYGEYENWVNNVLPSRQVRLR